MITIRYTGALADLPATERARLIERSAASSAEVTRRTADVIAAVKRDGDAALRDLARRYDGVDLEELEIPRAECIAALDRIDAPLRQAMQRAVSNIERVHRASLPSTIEVRPEPGIVVGRRPDPLERVGVYAPGGRAAYPSSVLMCAVPARVAGVGEVLLCSPPNATGRPCDAVLAAAELAGVDRLFALGGAGAIAAMALGTSSVPRVDRIVGPGNAYVAEAKRQVSGIVGIDSPAGPSELVVIADETCDARTVAREMIAQAEHDPLACVVALLVGDDSVRAVTDALQEMVVVAPRRDVIERALAEQGAVLSVANSDEAVAFANEYAPEHLLLALDTAERLLPSVRNAGTVFVGECASVAFGDYMTGANHVLPTGGAARWFSGLSVLAFVRWTTYQRVDRRAAARLAADVSVFAEAEGLSGHALAGSAWRADTPLGTARAEAAR